LLIAILKPKTNITTLDAGSGSGMTNYKTTALDAGSGSGMTIKEPGFPPKTAAGMTGEDRLTVMTADGRLYGNDEQHLIT
jgi:hypothetical protein